MKITVKKIVFLVLSFLPLLLQAQGGEKVQLIQAGSLEGIVLNGEELRKLIGDVVFKHDGALLYCDSAYQYEKKNEIECFGHVRMRQGDTITLTGNKLLYSGNTKRAIVTGDVVLNDKKMTLYTDYLDYDTKIKLATYQEGGRIIDEDNVMTSQRGYYNTASKIFWFKKDVKLVNDKEQYTLVSDTLEYHTITKIATFRGPSKVTKNGDILYADHGEYETDKGRSRFTGRARVESDSYVLEGDRLRYDELGRYGIAEGNVKVTSQENDLEVFGDLAHYWGKDGVVKVTGRPLVKNKMDSDTLFMTADTLISVDRKNAKDTTIKEKYLQAFHNVKIFKTDIQAKCDSLIYNFVDSTIYLYNDPLMWSDGSQVKADSMNLLMRNKRSYRMDTNINSFIVSEDTAKNYNQVKGKKMVAYFANDKISRVNVTGNGQSVYHALEENSTRLIGMNKADCSNITIRFENGEVRNITFINKPDAKFIPPHEILEEEARLKGFQWRINERPTKIEVAYRRDIEKHMFRLDYGGTAIQENTFPEFVQIPYVRGYRPPKEAPVVTGESEEEDPSLGKRKRHDHDAHEHHEHEEKKKSRKKAK